VNGSISILYVEDDVNSADILKLYLEKEGYEVTHYTNALNAERALDNLSFHLAILDVMIPDGDGFSLLKKTASKDIPSIMVTARVAEDDRLNGFDLGADDYVCKPYSPREVVSRVQALLKRSFKHLGMHQVLRYRQLQIDVNAKSVTVKDKPLKLTAVEFAILVFMANHAQQIISREQLIESVWEGRTDITDRAVDTHLANLRKKLGDNTKDPSYIATHYGQGYQFIAAKQHEAKD